MLMAPKFVLLMVQTFSSVNTLEHMFMFNLWGTGFPFIRTNLKVLEQGLRVSMSKNLVYL